MNRVILDTDIGADVSDVAALSLYLSLGRAGRLTPLGVMLSTGNKLALPSARIFQAYYGTDVPMGAAGDGPFMNYSMHWKYTRYLVEAFPLPRDARPALPYLTTYRRILAAQPDKSVTIVLNGPARGLVSLLESAPDAESPLTGHDLLWRKVRRVVSTAALFQENLPDNRVKRARSGWDVWSYTSTAMYVDWDAAAARRFNDKCPVPVDYIGVEVSYEAQMGSRFCQCAQENHPLKLCYRHFTKGGDHISGGALAVYDAAFGAPDAETLPWSEAGKVEMDAVGRMRLNRFPEGPDRYCENRVAEAVVRSAEDGIA